MLSRLAVIGALALGWMGVIPAWLMWTVVGVGVGIVLADFMLILQEMRRAHVPAGADSLVGKTATTRTRLAPDGFVFLDGERWRAVMEAGYATPGEQVDVVGVDGLCLRVHRIDRDRNA